MSSKIDIGLPTGMRDFDAVTIHKRAYIKNSITANFQAYGFEPLETPAMEQLKVLTGKYGEEGDQLIFKVLNNGIHKKESKSNITNAWEELITKGKNSSTLTERALKYDLTIPLARYVVTNYHNLTFPFRRFQIQNVWRADKPQKSRYREFTQCDADIVGSNSLWDEVDLLSLYLDVFKQLAINIEIQINHRFILQALQDACQIPIEDKHLIITIDKIDKIGLPKVLTILSEENNLTPQQLDIVEQYLTIEGNFEEKIQALEKLFPQSSPIQEVKDQLGFLLSKLPSSASEQVHLELKLARGLEYYTGCIFEVKATSNKNISIGGGGRYDNLTSMFGGRALPGVGISFGIDRIFDIMESENAFPTHLNATPLAQLLWVNFDDNTSSAIYPYIHKLRSKGINTILYPTNSKLQKQLKYAELNHIPFVALVGQDELANNTVTLKNMQERTQKSISLESILQYTFS